MEFMEFDETSYLLCDLYAAKCDALRIDNTEQLRVRFVHAVQGKLLRGVLDLSSYKLSKSCSPAIVKIVQKLGSQIHTLVLDDNPLEDVGIIALERCEEQLNNLTDLSLVSVGLTPEGLIDFLQHFSAECKLMSLNLGSNPSAEKRNRFNEESCAFMARFVCKCKNLYRLDFSNTYLRGLNGYNLFKHMNSECTLRILNISNTGVSNSAIYQLCIENARFLPFIEHLNVSGNQTLSGECCAALANMILYQRHFHELFVADCYFGEYIRDIFSALGYGSAEQLAEYEAFKRRNAVREAYRNKELCGLHYGVKNLIETGKVILNVDEAEKKAAKTYEIEYTAEKTCAVSMLDLTNCKISALNLGVLAVSLKVNQSLEVLKMENCSLDMNRVNIQGLPEFQQPFEKFCEALASHPRISQINLSKNSILDVGAANFGGLLQLQTLRIFNVNYCRINNDGIVNIAKGIGQATALERLYIAGNNCDDVAGQALFANLQNYTKLKVLDISLNKISFYFAEKLQTLIKQNVEQSCSEVYQSLMQRVNGLEAQLNELNFVDVETVKYRTEYNDLVKQLKEAAESMIKTHETCEANLQAEYAQLDELRKQQIAKDTELAQETIKVNEIQTRIDYEMAICEQKKRIIKDKTVAIQHQIEVIEEEYAEEEEDEEMNELEKRLDRKLKEKKALEKECVSVLAQLAACEAILVKEGVVYVAQPRKARK